MKDWQKRDGRIHWTKVSIHTKVLDWANRLDPELIQGGERDHNKSKSESDSRTTPMHGPTASGTICIDSHASSIALPMASPEDCCERREAVRWSRPGLCSRQSVRRIPWSLAFCGQGYFDLPYVGVCSITGEPAWAAIGSILKFGHWVGMGSIFALGHWVGIGCNFGLGN